MDYKLKQKISSEADRYDFKLLQKKFHNAEDPSVYLSSEELNSKIKDESN